LMYRNRQEVPDRPVLISLPTVVHLLVPTLSHQ
jgi:hypothetical protein